MMATSLTCMHLSDSWKILINVSDDVQGLMFKAQLNVLIWLWREADIYI